MFAVKLKQIKDNEADSSSDFNAPEGDGKLLRASICFAFQHTVHFGWWPSSMGTFVVRQSSITDRRLWQTNLGLPITVTSDSL